METEKSFKKFESLKNPASYSFEELTCYSCGSGASKPLVIAQDDLTGKPGNFRFVKCEDCGLAYQNPRIVAEQIGTFYDNEYIAHRKKKDWGLLQPLYERAMDKHDREKEKLVLRYKPLGPDSQVLDVGCAVGSFLLKLKKNHKSHGVGVDFKDLSHFPGFDQLEFHWGLFPEQQVGKNRFDLITMWHFLEHCYTPNESLKHAQEALKDDGIMVIEVPRLDSVSFWLYKERWPGLQAPQHTVLFDKASLLAMVDKAGLEVVDYLAYGAFPPYFYLFTGFIFKFLKGKGLDLDRFIFPYFLGQLLYWPVSLFENHLNLSMQTVICRKKK
jgi:SAM-dependent methyltransferase